MRKITKKRIAYFWILSCILALAAGYLLSGCGAGGGGGTGGGSNPPTNPPVVTNVIFAFDSPRVITVIGQNFGSSRALSTVAVGGALLTSYTTWTDTQVVGHMSPLSMAGNTRLMLSTSAGSDSADIAILAEITALNPVTGCNGTQVTITGAGFGNAQGTNFVTFDDVSAGVAMVWSASQIIVNAPNSKTGQVRTHVNNTLSDDETSPNFTYAAPSITSLNPTSGPVGGSVTITGTNFGTSQGTSKVAFNGTDAGTATTWVSTQIVVTVPTGATTGNVIVTTGAGSSNGVNFTVTEPVDYKLVFDREYNLGAGVGGIAPIGQTGVLAVLQGSEIVLVNANTGAVLYQTTHGCGGTGIAYLNNKLYVSYTQNSRYSIDTTNWTINETPEITSTWGSQHGYANIINNSVVFTSFNTKAVGVFDTNLTIPPTNVYNFSFGVNDMVSNSAGTIGWVTDGAFGQIAQVNLQTGEYSTWTVSVPASGIDYHQNTIFLTGPCSINPNLSYLSSYHPDGTLIWQSDELGGWFPKAIRVYYNSGNSSEEAAVTGDDGRLHIYKVVEN